MKIWCNGKIAPAETSGLAWSDRGFLLGDGVFETIALKNQQICHWDAHWTRLGSALSYFSLPASYDQNTIKAAILELAMDVQATEAAIRITVSAGAGGRGLAPQAISDPTWVVSLSPRSPSSPTLALAQVAVTRTAGNPSSMYKTLSYIDNIMARRLANGDEAFMLNQYGRLSCAAAGNIFLLANGELLTPALSEGALNGIIRGVILSTGAIAGFTSREARLTLSDMKAAEAIFITNSLVGAQSVSTLLLTNHEPIKKGSPHMATILETIHALAF